MIPRYFPLLIILPLLLLMACQADNKQLQDEDTSKVVQLSCINKSTDDGKVIHYIYAEVGYNKVKLASLEACDPITIEAYKRFQIPSGAIVARGGNKEDSLQSIYAIKKDGKLLFYKSVGADKQLISTYQDGKFNFTQMK